MIFEALAKSFFGFNPPKYSRAQSYYGVSPKAALQNAVFSFGLHEDVGNILVVALLAKGIAISLQYSTFQPFVSRPWSWEVLVSKQGF